MKVPDNEFLIEKSVYVQYIIITWILSFRTWTVSAGITNYLPEIIKVMLNEPHGNWRLTVIQSECKTSLLIML